MTATIDHARIARLLNQGADILKQLATEFQLDGIDASPPPNPTEMLNLGSLQQAILEALLTADENGLSPREITKMLKRGDEPNVRGTLYTLEQRGVAERLPTPKQRWRVASIYASE